MKIIYSGESHSIKGKSIFLAGCSPRIGQTLKWREEAISYYENFGFSETLIIPEPKSGEPWEDYISVIQWEDYYLQIADVILFWIPRSVKDEIYGFTSNIEFGKYLNSGKIVYGRPDDSDNNRYLDYWYETIYKIPPAYKLENLVFGSIIKLSNTHD